MIKKFYLMLTLTFIFLLSACTVSLRGGENEIVFIPPTLAATIYRTPTIDPFFPTPDANPCKNYLSYVEDITIPDGTILSSGEAFTKKWKVENSGTCDWSNKYSVRNIGGNTMDASERSAIPQLKSGEEGEISIDFLAPQEIGFYYSQWQAYDERGKAYGEDIYLEINVIAEIE